MISESRLADSLLSELARWGLRFAFLHGEDRHFKGELLSDIDLLVEEDPYAVVFRLACRREMHGLVLVEVWPYDVGALTSFWMTPRGDAVVQLDLLQDPRGLGTYGLRTDYALSRAQAGHRWPRVRRADEATYVAVKRAVKGQTSRALTSLSMAHAPSSEEAGKLLSEESRHVLARLAAGVPYARGIRRRLRTYRHLLGRATSPPGICLKVSQNDLDAVAGLAKEWANLLPRVTVLDARAPRFPCVLLNQRVGLTLLVSEPGPSVLTSTSAGLAPLAVAAMHAASMKRLTRRLGVGGQTSQWSP
jgi:hypothetical protein